VIVKAGVGGVRPSNRPRVARLIRRHHLVTPFAPGISDPPAQETCK
jgi:hypothetical protein